ncbi:DEAD/DEAH box helicase [Candidatus Dojkabacteria bacterium]|nr:DEAD/DEAH box helicase [Candidatus Dojkabacteria bacterium]
MSQVNSLDDSIQKVPMVGPKYASRLVKIGIETVRDLLFHIPFRYKDTSEIITIDELKEEGAGMIVATVDSISSRRAGRYLIIQAKLSDESGSINAVWFNQPYLRKTLKKDSFYYFEGKLKTKNGYTSLSSPAFEKYDESKEPGKQVHLGRITPFYELTSGVSSKWVRSRLNFLKKEILRLVEEPLSAELLDKFSLEKLPVAIFKIHFPESWDDIEKARKRLAFDEFLRLGLKIEEKILKNSQRKAPQIVQEKYKKELEELMKSLSFKLTLDQEKALDDIMQDISRDIPMNRLLNGDVGSGKTIVAVIASYLTILSGHDVIIMAPTTILARQHYAKFSEYLEKFNIKIQLLTSGEILEPTAENEIIIGTHALLYEEFLPEDVGLVIVDEQHRFGVLQREHLLKNKTGGKNDTNLKMPHYLSMTATPIPRTLTHVLYGDSSVSQIKMMPPGRIPVETHYVPNRKRKDCLKWVADFILKGRKSASKRAQNQHKGKEGGTQLEERSGASPEAQNSSRKNAEVSQQAFVIFPLVEESEKLELKSAVEQYKKLSEGIFKDLRVGLVHGRMKQEEKDEVLMKFKNCEFDVLVATSVVEVGIDIPNATIMVIEDADRFGLAQLHQFRGRVGRNMMQSYCYVIASATMEKGGAAEERLKYFSKHNSGFDVAEFDLKMRGPGEVYGLAQSGIPDLKVADLADVDGLLRGREAAAGLLRTLHEKEIAELKGGLFR